MTADRAGRGRDSPSPPVSSSEPADSHTACKRQEKLLRGHASELELLLRERTAELEQRTEDLEAFSTSVAHDLRAPIRVMRTYAEALLNLHGKDMDESAREFTTRIVDSTASMELMIERLLDYGRALAGSAFELSPASLLRVFHETLRYLDAYILESGAVVTISGGDYAVCGHETTLIQVVANLVTNAIKFTRAGEAPLVTLSAEREGDRVRLSVQDTGIGVPPEDQDRIFRIFERSHNAKDYPGSGVGLAIVKKGVERMHGQVGVESTPGEGSLFWVMLPAA
jgi:signal transduction histidine kinase